MGDLQRQIMQAEQEMLRKENTIERIEGEIVELEHTNKQRMNQWLMIHRKLDACKNTDCGGHGLLREPRIKDFSQYCQDATVPVALAPEETLDEATQQD